MVESFVSLNLLIIMVECTNPLVCTCDFVKEVDHDVFFTSTVQEVSRCSCGLFKM